jgi:hypothetical protein
VSRTTVTTHVFRDDSITWLDHIRRCCHVVGGHGEECGLPEQNKIHDVRDTTEQDRAHRQRTGDRGET